MTLFPFHHALSGPLTLWGNYQEVNKSFIQSCQYALHEPGVLWARCLNLPPSLGFFGFVFFFSPEYHALSKHPLPSAVWCRG